jgi:hypothetical protein
MSTPFMKEEAREFAKQTRSALRCMETALLEGDWYAAYQKIYQIGGGADLLIESFEDWERGEDS